MKKDRVKVEISLLLLRILEDTGSKLCHDSMHRLHLLLLSLSFHSSWRQKVLDSMVASITGVRYIGKMSLFLI
jgi:hypothetical protein